MVNHSPNLTPEQASVFLEVLNESLRISRREQFFTWLQGGVQHLFPHEVLICGMQAKGEQGFHFERFISTRYVTDQHVSDATGERGVVGRVIASWCSTRRPTFLAEGMSPGDYGRYVVPFEEHPSVLHATELRNIAMHGLGNRDGGVSTFFCFSRMPGELETGHAHLLELLVPHLHAVLMRVFRSGSVALTESADGATAVITTREREILQWVHNGKTNGEIASILDISPLTVKNHVQNILRKLSVNNRSHAVVKAARLGLVKA